MDGLGATSQLDPIWFEEESRKQSTSDHKTRGQTGVGGLRQVILRGSLAENENRNQEPAVHKTHSQNKAFVPSSLCLAIRQAA